MEARNYDAIGLEGDFAGKIRILTISDDPRSNTGFGKVHKNIINSIKDNERYYVTSMGWYSPTHAQTKSQIYNADGLSIVSDPDYRIIPVASSETYGIPTFKKVVDFFRPNIVITVGDPWMVDGIAKFKEQYEFIWIGYVPIDGLDMPVKFKGTLSQMDYVVTYGRFGSQVLASTDFDMTKVTEICHGVDEKLYTPSNKIQAREKLEIPTNPFLVLWVGRNIHRKRVDVMLEAFSKFISPSISCRNCGAIYFKGHSNYEYIDSQKRCLSCQLNLEEDQIIKFRGREDCMLFLHTTSFDIGFEINEYIHKYGLNGKIIAPSNLQVGMGIPEEDMATIYNAADVFVNTSTAEGWGMPIHEAMASGVPVVVPDFGGYIESLVQKNETGFCYAVESLDRTDIGYIRCKPHPTDLAKYLDLIYNANMGGSMSDRWQNQDNLPIELLNQIIEKGLQRARELSWDNFKRKWSSVINNSIPEVQRDKLIADKFSLKEVGKKRIVIATDNLVPFHGGAEKSIFEIAKQLREKDCEVICLYYRNGEGIFNKYRLMNVEGISIIQAVLTEEHISDTIKQLQPDLVITQLRLISTVGKICFENDIPYDVFIRSYEGICESPLRMTTCHFNCSSCSTYLTRDNMSLRSEFTKALNCARKVVCNSQFTKELLAMTQSISKSSYESHTEIMYPFIDTDNQSFMVSDFAPRVNRYITLIKGTEAKGSLIFFDIIEKLQNDHPEIFEKYQFLMVGKRDRITVDIIQRLSINNLVVSDTVSDMAQVYAQSAVVLIPSIWKEPFGRVAIEAGLNRVPILVADNAGLQEATCRNCRIKNYFNTDSWIQALILCLEDGEHKNQLIDAQYDHARNIQESTSNQMLQYVESCL